MLTSSLRSQRFDKEFKLKAQQFSCTGSARYRNAMDYLLFSNLVWFTACFISLCYLTLFRTRKSATYDYSLSKIFSLYLIVYVMSNFMILMAYIFPKYHAVLKLLGVWLLLLLPRCMWSYLRL